MRKEIRLRGRNWYANTRFMGELLQDCLDTSDEKIARRRLEHLKAMIERGDYQVSKKKFGELANQYLDEILPKKGKASQARYESIVRVHLIPFFVSTRLGEVDEKVKAYFDEKGKLPESSLKKHARVLRDIIRLGDKNFKLPSIVYRRGFYQTRFLSNGELDHVIRCLDEHYRSLALLLAHTGLRLSNAINLNWADVRLNKDMIEVKQSKTGDFVRIPLTEAVSDMMKLKQRVRRMDGNIFDVTVRAFQKAWKRAVRKACLDWSPRPHDLRHFFCSSLLNKGVDHLTVATLSGHKGVNLLKERYGHLTDDTLRKAISTFNGCRQTVAN
ncbi:site-specific integrase [Nitrospina gracilis]|nr:site-specific integrase [Nitrospina gracilis]